MTANRQTSGESEESTDYSLEESYGISVIQDGETVVGDAEPSVFLGPPDKEHSGRGYPLPQEEREPHLVDESVHRFEDLEPEHIPDVPDQVVWSAYVSYNCRDCVDLCLNRVDSQYAQHKVCRGCFPDFDPDERVSLSRHLPDDATQADVRRSVERVEADD